MAAETQEWLNMSVPTTDEQIQSFITTYAGAVVSILLACLGFLATSIVFFVRKILTQIDMLIANAARELSAIKREINDFKQEFMRQVVKVEDDHTSMLEKHFQLKTTAEVHQKECHVQLERIDSSIDTLKDNQDKIFRKLCANADPEMTPVRRGRNKDDK